MNEGLFLLVDDNSSFKIAKAKEIHLYREHEDNVDINEFVRDFGGLGDDVPIVDSCGVEGKSSGGVEGQSSDGVKGQGCGGAARQSSCVVEK
ncbi:hypothetical protein GH714_040152 [Hevea brasiliensis]|uniref:Uncharacterized protein n=1 Tax=Hevea brasiliensis TaxID=3981 RepID=A0A6A6MTL0_HEVBR|nr:hypothetical protein GH714_040152 [Hevea brasiliensis]